MDDAWSGLAAVFFLFLNMDMVVIVKSTWSAFDALVVARIMLGLGLGLAYSTPTPTPSASSCSIAPYDASARSAIDDQTQRHRGALPTFTLYSYVQTQVTRQSEDPSSPALSGWLIRPCPSVVYTHRVTAETLTSI